MLLAAVYSYCDTWHRQKSPGTGAFLNPPPDVVAHSPLFCTIKSTGATPAS